MSSCPTLEITNASLPSTCFLQKTSKTSPGPKDLAQNVDDGPKQPKLSFYPKTKFFNRMRHFSVHWYQMFKWIEYSVMEDTVFCFPCRFFSKHFDGDTIFVTVGYKNWKKALEKSSGFKKHDMSNEHKQCQFMLTEYVH